MNLNFVGGNSIVASLIREKDWSKTVLGPIDSWPQNLKSMVGVMLANRFPMYIIWGPQFIQLYNDAYLSILGADRHPQALGAPSETTWPDIWNTLQPMYEKVYQSGKPIGFDDYFLPHLKQGIMQDAYFSFSYNPIWNEENKVAGIAVICEETTQRILYLKKLKEHAESEANARARLEAIFKGSASPIVFFKGPDHIYEIFNQKYQDLVPGRQLANRPLLEALPELTGSAYPKFISKVYESGESAVITEEFAPLINLETGLTEERYFDSVISRINDVNGTGGVLVQVLEATERVRSRKLLRAEMEKNRLASQQIEEILEGMGEGFFSVDKDWIVQRVNAQFEKVVGVNRADILGKHFLEFFFSAPEHKTSKYVECYQKVMSERSANSFVDYYEPFNIWTAVTAYPTSNGGMAAFFREISAERRAAKRLEEAILARDTFLSVASHELRTPITSMKLHGHLMEKRIEKLNLAHIPVTEVKNMVEKNIKGLDRMNRLVEDMLDISRIQSGKLAMNFEQVDVLALILNVIDRYSEQLEAAKIETKVSSEQKAYLCKIDSFRMEQVLINLITNTIRYAPGTPLEIKLRELETNFLEISFEDLGQGIAETDRERIFGRFERGILPNGASGLGLGLFIVREIIKGHGGTIHVEQNEPQGAKFVIRLPLIDQT